jgi:hypothetical protein
MMIRKEQHKVQDSSFIRALLDDDTERTAQGSKFIRALLDDDTGRTGQGSRFIRALLDDDTGRTAQGSRFICALFPHSCGAISVSHKGLLRQGMHNNHHRDSPVFIQTRTLIPHPTLSCSTKFHFLRVTHGRFHINCFDRISANEGTPVTDE